MVSFPMTLNDPLHSSMSNNKKMVQDRAIVTVAD